MVKNIYSTLHKWIIHNIILIAYNFWCLLYYEISFHLGNVYNVTAYMEYHPGGWDELIKGAGRDATDLFNDAHRCDIVNIFYNRALYSFAKHINV